MNVLLVALTLATSPQAAPLHPDPVVAQVLAHIEARPIIVVIDRTSVSPAMWARVKNLNAFRVHREVDGRVVTDAPVFLVKGAMYREAAGSRDPRADVWCKLAAVVLHELEHTGPDTEDVALAAERAQIERCANAGHLHGATYILELARKHRHEVRQ